MTDLDLSTNDFRGTGWAFPVRVGAGAIEAVSGDEDVRQSIHLILATAKGERVMRPDFGCGIHDLVFAAVSTQLIARVRREVEDALRTYEARIEVLRVAVATGGPGGGPARRRDRLPRAGDQPDRQLRLPLLLPGGLSPMTVRLPSTDARRAAVLRAELDRAGSAMVPGWGVAVAPGSFGRALLEIAARFAEETSSRLDRTAERDALAFYDTLDVPPPAPQAATATLVFVTEEARTTTTSAPLRVQVGATVEDQEVIFETTRALEVSPARIAEVVAVDPDTDHIERAPGRVVATERPPDPVGGRLLVTAASAGSTIVQVAPAIGLEPGDQLRIQGTAYRIASVSQDLVTLVDPLAAAVPAGTPFQKIEALEAFTLRDLQQHACYVGHTSLLNLERPARIELVLTPSGLAARLAALDLRYSLWGTKDGEDEPAWQALELVGGSATTLTVRKRWEGSVDEVEVDGRKSRWLRIEHPQPITTVGVGADADRVRLTVRSEDPSRHVGARAGPGREPDDHERIPQRGAAGRHRAIPAVRTHACPVRHLLVRRARGALEAGRSGRPGHPRGGRLVARAGGAGERAGELRGNPRVRDRCQRPAPLGDDLDRGRRALARAAQPGRRRR